MENKLTGLQKVTTESPYESAIPFGGIYPPNENLCPLATLYMTQHGMG